MITLGVDVGGTFTDVVLWDGKALTVCKVSSTQQDQSEGIMIGARAIAPAGMAADLIHGTTVATNALLERRGARTLLVTDKGFESLIEIARQDRPSLYDPFADRARPLVDADLRVGVEIPGSVTDAELSAIVDDLVSVVVERNVNAVAVCLMYSYSDPVQENRLCNFLRHRLAFVDSHSSENRHYAIDSDRNNDGRHTREDDATPVVESGLVPGESIAVSASADVVAEFREYERFSTTVVNAFLSPEVARYMDSLTDRADRAGFIDDISVMRSSGGLVSLDYASAFPSSILLSGPAGGVVASAAIARQMGIDTLISFDMGGTSTDVCRVRRGRSEVTYNREIAGHACLMPSVAVHTVGAGGGSIAWVDSGKALRVGPRSAGAYPGPVCYGCGGSEPTVTDANLVLGRLDPNTKLANTMLLRRDLAIAAFEKLGAKLSLDPVATALGVIAVVEAHMISAVRAVSIEQGTDPRDAVMAAFGGAGGLHSSALARALDMKGVIIPPHAGVFSAFGLLLSPTRADTAQTVNIVTATRDRLPYAAKRLLAVARCQLESDSGQSAQTESLIVDMRYRGQAHETSVPYDLAESWDTLCARFHRLHAQRNGFSRPEDSVEAVTVRAEAVGSAALTWSDLPEFVHEPGNAMRSFRTVIGPSGPVEAEVWWRPSMVPGTTVFGPAIIEETDSTVYLGSGERAVVLESGVVRIDW